MTANAVDARSASDIAASLIADTPLLAVDEQAFMREIFDRVLVIGRARYSPWDASNDARDLRKEGDEEIFDAVIYAAMLVVKRRREREERKRCFIHDEAYARVEPGLKELAASVGLLIDEVD
jgi:hypothetical protein